MIRIRNRRDEYDQFTENSFQRQEVGLLRNNRFWIVVAFVSAAMIAGCGGNKQAADRGVKAELISIRPITGNKVKLMLKVTNVSGQDIVRAKALVDVLDSEGKSLGTKSTYLIHSGKGGLAAGSSVEEDAFIDVSDNTKAVKMTFAIEDVRFKEPKR